MFCKELETSVYWMTHKHNIKGESKKKKKKKQTLSLIYSLS